MARKASTVNERFFSKHEDMPTNSVDFDCIKRSTKNHNDHASKLSNRIVQRRQCFFLNIYVIKSLISSNK